MTGTRQAQRHAALVAAALAALGGLLTFWLTVRSPVLRVDDPGGSSTTAFIVGMVLLAGAGALLVRHGAGGPMGWLLLGTGVAGVLSRLALAAAVAAHEAGLGITPALAWLTNWAWVPGQAIALWLLLRFPDGTLPGPRWRPVEWLLAGWAGTTVLATALHPDVGAEQLEPLRNPLGWAGAEGALDTLLSLVFAIAPLLALTAVAALVARWRGAGPATRAQLTPVLVAAGLIGVAAPLALLTDAGRVLEGLAWLVLPGAIAYAVVRRKLWDVDLQQRFDRLRRVRDEERARLQRDLHDSLGPLLGSISMRLEAARNLLDAGAPADRVDALLAAINHDTETAVVEIRRLLEELRPSVLEDTDLATALRRLAQGAAVAVDLDVPDLPALDPAVEVVAYRVAAEALRNVDRHSGASRCTLAVRVTDGLLDLEVADDGAGLRSAPAGVGRRAMADRVTALGGTLTVADAPGGGVRVRASLPGAVSREPVP